MPHNNLSKQSTLIDTREVQLLSPLFPDNSDDLKNQILKYFNSCLEKKRYFTFTGLANHLGLTREELINFIHDNPKTEKLILQAKQIIVEQVENILLSGTPPGGLVFWLKNNDNWIDKFEHTHTDKKISDLLNELEQEGKIIKGEIISDKTNSNPYASNNS